MNRRALALIYLVAVVAYADDAMSDPPTVCPAGSVCPIEAGDVAAAPGWYYTDAMHGLRLQCEDQRQRTAELLVAARTRAEQADVDLKACNADRVAEANALMQRSADLMTGVERVPLPLPQGVCPDCRTWQEPVAIIAAATLAGGACYANDVFGGPWWGCGIGVGATSAALLVWRW